MPATHLHTTAASALDGAVDDSAIEQVLVIPECDALNLYARLSSTQQWRARIRATGQRRDALTRYHALEIARLR